MSPNANRDNPVLRPRERHRNHNPEFSLESPVLQESRGLPSRRPPSPLDEAYLLSKRANTEQGRGRGLSSVVQGLYRLLRHTLCSRGVDLCAVTTRVGGSVTRTRALQERLPGACLRYTVKIRFRLSRGAG